MLALLLWVIVAADRPASAWITVPVQVVLPDGNRASDSRTEPGAVAVRFTGDGDEMWELAVKRSRVRLLLQVGEPVAAHVVYSLGTSMVQVPPGLSVLARDIRPVHVRVRPDAR